MLKKTNLSITWADLIFITLLVVGGIGVWAYFAERVTADLKTGEPVEEYVTNTSEVVTAKANLANAQAELTALQEEAGKQRTTLEQSKAQIQAFRNANPSLASLPGSGMLSPETLSAYWEAQLQVETLRRQIEDLESLITSLIAQKTQLTLNQRELEKDTEQALIAAEQSSYIEDQLTASKAKIVELKPNLLEQQAKVSSLEAFYPGLANYSLVKQTQRYPSSAVLQKYLEALTLQDETQTTLSALEKQASAKNAEVIAATTAATEAQKNAHSDYLKAEQKFLDGKEWQIILISGISVVIYFVAVMLFYLLIARLRKSAASILPVLLLSLVPLLILIGYQEFRVMGGALLSLVALILLLGYLAIFSRRPQGGKPE